MKKIFWQSDCGNIIIEYSPFFLGNKYKIKRKIIMEQTGKEHWEFIIAFNFFGEAHKYASQMFDEPIYQY